MIQKKITMIPVAKDDGHMLKCVNMSYPNEDGHFKWIKNHVWHDTIQVIEIENNSSDSQFIVRSVISGKKYYMFMNDLLSMMKNSLVESGNIQGNFTYVQRGHNYGIRKA